MKVCSACKTNKPLDAFSADPRYRLGVTGHCRTCMNEASRLRGLAVQLLPKPEVGEKQCLVCKTTKPLTAFSQSSRMLDGRAGRCKECRNRTISDNLYRMDPGRALKRRLAWYGMTVEDFHGLIDEQHGLCACCNEPFTKPVIDHDHESGAIRGLLCFRCNNWLTAIEHPAFLRMAQNYLAKTAIATTRFRIKTSTFASRKKQKADDKARRLA